jgi:NADH-quinone oxidoreductase subunit C
MINNTSTDFEKLKQQVADLAILDKLCPHAVIKIELDHEIADMPILEVESMQLKEVATILRDHEAFGFEMLMDVCGVDYLAYGQTEWQTSDSSSTGFCRGVDKSLDKAKISLSTPKRFAVVYHLLSVKHNTRLRLRCFIDGEPPEIDSVCDIWNSANWFEREAFDLFGIVFKNHPDLRRILTDYGFVGHPFRKDFPLSGNVEVHYNEVEKRVMYRPVTVQPRTLVPRVVRKDSRYNSSDIEGSK